MILSGNSGSGLHVELLSADDLQKLVTWQEMGRRGAKLGSWYKFDILQYIQLLIDINSYLFPEFVMDNK